MNIKNETSTLAAMSQYRPRIACQLCGKEFTQLDKLSFHIYNNCKDDAENMTIDENRGTAVIDPVTKQEDNANEFSNINGSTENEDGSGRQHVCDICGKQFPKLQNLQVHVRSHTGEKPYSCQWCGKNFTSYGNMKAHSRVHTGLRPHQCPTCGKEFGTAQNLQVHIRTHTGERPYKCSECGKGFAGQGNLKVHQRTHTGERPYKCQMCGKDFRNLQSLHIHVRSHTGEKPYECTFCHKAFTSQGNMQAHMRIHTGERPFSCGECDKSFANMQALKIHIRTHTGERPHVCHVCGKDFASLGNFQVHMRTHSGLKPFTCRMCAHEFLTLSNMQEHMVRTHATELYAENALLWTRMQHLSAMQMQMPGTSGNADSSSLLGLAHFPQAGIPSMDFSLGLEQMFGMNHKTASATATNDTKDVPTDDNKVYEDGSIEGKDKKLESSTTLSPPSRASEFASASPEPSIKIPNNVVINVNDVVDKEHQGSEAFKTKTFQHSFKNKNLQHAFKSKALEHSLKIKSLEQFEETAKYDARIPKISEKSIGDSSILDEESTSSKHARQVSSLKEEQSHNGAGLNSNGMCRTVKARASIPTMASGDKAVFTTGCDGNDSVNIQSRSGTKITDGGSGALYPTKMPTSDSVSDIMGPYFGHLPGNPSKRSPEACFGSSSSDGAFAGLGVRQGSGSSVGNSDLFNSRMQTKISTLGKVDADASLHDVFSMNRPMQYGYHLPPVNSFALTNDYAINMLRGQGSTGDALYNVAENAVNMFGYMNTPSYVPSVGPAKHFMDMFSLPGVQGHATESHGTVQSQTSVAHGQRSDTGNNSARNSLQMNQALKQSISPTELNSFVQTALDMFSSEKNSNSQYSELLDLKVNQSEEPSYCGSGGPVFPTNM